MTAEGPGVEVEVKKPLSAREEGRRGVKAAEEQRAGVETPERKGERKGGGRAVGRAEVGREAVEGGGGWMGMGARMGREAVETVEGGKAAEEVAVMGGSGVSSAGREMGGSFGGVPTGEDDAPSVSVLVVTLPPSSSADCFSSTPVAVDDEARLAFIAASGVLLPLDPASLPPCSCPPILTLDVVGLSGATTCSPAPPSIAGNANLAGPARPIPATDAGEPPKTSRTGPAEETLEGGRDGSLVSLPNDGGGDKLRASSLSVILRIASSLGISIARPPALWKPANSGLAEGAEGFGSSKGGGEEEPARHFVALARASAEGRETEAPAAVAKPPKEEKEEGRGRGSCGWGRGSRRLGLGRREGREMGLGRVEGRWESGRRRGVEVRAGGGGIDCSRGLAEVEVSGTSSASSRARDRLSASVETIMGLRVAKTKPPSCPGGAPPLRSE